MKARPECLNILIYWSKYLGPIWVLSAPDGPHVGPMNLVIRDRSDTELTKVTVHNHILHWMVECYGESCPQYNVTELNELISP